MDRPTLSKVLRWWLQSVTLDMLASRLTALGRNVEIRVGLAGLKVQGNLVVRAASPIKINRTDRAD